MAHEQVGDKASSFTLPRTASHKPKSLTPWKSISILIRIFFTFTHLYQAGLDFKQSETVNSVAVIKIKLLSVKDTVFTPETHLSICLATLGSLLFRLH